MITSKLEVKKFQLAFAAVDFPVCAQMLVWVCDVDIYLLSPVSVLFIILGKYSDVSFEMEN